MEYILFTFASLLSQVRWVFQDSRIVQKPAELRLVWDGRLGQFQFLIFSNLKFNPPYFHIIFPFFKVFVKIHKFHSGNFTRHISMQIFLILYTHFLLKQLSLIHIYMLFSLLHSFYAHFTALYAFSCTLPVWKMALQTSGKCMAMDSCVSFASCFRNCGLGRFILKCKLNQIFTPSLG